MKPKLSICIPTYNRDQYLRRLLDSIVQHDFNISFEVLISDNASEDETEAICKSYCSNKLNWRYFRNSRNLGGKRNIRLCTEHATGNYLIIIGDDDSLRPQASKYLPMLLSRMDETQSKAAFCFDDPTVKSKQMTDSFRDFSWLRKHSINVPAFISAVVWNNEFWRSYPYYDYREDLSLPQLDAFIEAGCTQMITIGHSALVNPGDAKSDWFQTRHPLVDCIEYPLLYKKVFANSNMSTGTWIIAQLRRVVLLRHIYGKLLYMRSCGRLYEFSYPAIIKSHQGTLIAWVVKFMCWVVLKSKLGGYLANRRFPGNQINSEVLTDF